jgi:DNA-binding XRE family transcriptional regulator
MPGKKITDHQVRKYKQHRNTLTQVAAAARAGISERSARRIEDTKALPSQRAPRSVAHARRPVAQTVGDHQDHLGSNNLEIRQRISCSTPIQLGGLVCRQIDTERALPWHVHPRSKDCTTMPYVAKSVKYIRGFIYKEAY